MFSSDCVIAEIDQNDGYGFGVIERSEMVGLHQHLLPVEFAFPAEVGCHGEVATVEVSEMESRGDFFEFPAAVNTFISVHACASVLPGTA